MRRIENAEAAENAVDQLLARTAESIERSLGRHIDVEARLAALHRRMAADTDRTDGDGSDRAR